MIFIKKIPAFGRLFTTATDYSLFHFDFSNLDKKMAPKQTFSLLNNSGIRQCFFFFFFFLGKEISLFFNKEFTLGK